MKLTIHDIEQKYPVESIRANGIPIWPYLRIYLADQLMFDKNRQVKASASSFKQVLFSVFYGFKNWFKQTDYLFISTASQRKLINNQYTDRFDIVRNNLSNSLLIENPIPKHFKLKSLKNKNCVSKSPWIIKERLLTKTRSIEIENEQTLIKILEEQGLTLNYKFLAKRFLAQKSIMDKFIKRKAIKALFLITPYTNMGYVYSAKMHKIPVIEFQHGIINKAHFAYNISKSICQSMYPDYLLSWGEEVKSVFTDKNHFINEEKVIPTGHFYLDYINNEYRGNKILQHALNPYKKSVAFTAQTAYEDKTTPIIHEIAKSNPDIAIVYVPRDKKSEHYQSAGFPKNVLFADDLNCYEIIYHCDFHSTINSSCAIEALCLGRKNILLNIDNLSISYYESMLDAEDTKFANSATEFAQFVKQLQAGNKKTIYNKYTKLVTPNFKENVNQVIKKLLNG